MKGLDQLSRAASRRTSDISTWTWATVTDDSPLRVQLDGESAPLDFTPDALVSGLAVDDRVWVQLVANPDPQRRHRRAIVTGKAAGQIIVAGSVTNAQLADMAQATIKGRASGAGTGAPTDLSATQAQAILGLTRMGCSIRRAANQSVGNATGGAVYVSWDTQDADTDALFAPTSDTVTIPSTGAGIWAVTVRLSWGSVLGGTARTFLALELNATANDVYRLPAAPIGEQFVGASWVLPFDASDAFKIQVYQSSGAANNLTAELHCYRVAI